MTFLERRPLTILAAGLILMTVLATTMARADDGRAERAFDPAAWPRQLSVAVEQAGPGESDLAMIPDQTRKSMVRDLVASNRLVGLRFSEVQALLGEGRVEDRVLVYALGDKPIGDYNPIILGILFDPAGRVAAAKAVQVD